MAAAATVLDANRVGGQAETLQRKLRQRIVGQEEAIEQVVRAYQTYLAGMNNPDRPVSIFLFLGPTGSGKTRMVEALAESLVGEAHAVIKIDCAEYQHGHEIAKLIGSPPGYLGHRETHPLLSQENLNEYHTEMCRLSFVLFDEIEKASPSLWNLLLGILDKGRLTLGDNRQVDFSRAFVFMTGNLGSAEMNCIIAPGIGFGGGAPSIGAAASNVSARMARAATEAARRKFSPEFLNRIDAAVVFQPLEQEQLRAILDLELNYVQRRILNAGQGRRFQFECSANAKDFLLREGTDARYGARHLKRAIERHVVQPLANLMATDQVRAGDLLRIDFSREAQTLVFLQEHGEAPASDGGGQRSAGPVVHSQAAVSQAALTTKTQRTQRSTKGS